jgi:glutamate-1-semialdehyde 2,1-aminomutase
MRRGLEEAAAAAGVAFSAPGSASVFTPFFTDGPVTNLAEAKTSDTAKHGRFFHGMLDAGIYLPPSQFELNFVSTAHTESDIDQAVDAAGRVLKEVARDA